jgi:hypothetical protein
MSDSFHMPANYTINDVVQDLLSQQHQATKDVGECNVKRVGRAQNYHLTTVTACCCRSRIGIGNVSVLPLQHLIFLKVIRWVPCHHGMACPQVADGGDSLQFWRVAANMFNKQSWTADKGWSSSLGLTTPHRKK